MLLQMNTVKYIRQAMEQSETAQAVNFASFITTAQMPAVK